MYVWQCKVNTNMYLFTTITPVNSRFLQWYSRTAAEARRVSVNYVIAGVNSKDSVQVSCKILADV